eukprot:CAMPEP_0174313670 /NCGR_PEP_ID=MMETSP0810-20121108/5146_1 /TAXON_ID=73025 ORGANISM="Eutreptiella gymnastica-like, Strain CCMP1594" /NCGR_SAMPLE_ID=MMETSP0810 /ASSEMBLY_ACC=CAM_ASM_000659 /LENGTH=223 /DNA_ID=CAMNT_0015422543 /DNA_START=956 /DNA_END=1629 /DNA_ORIENTATION=+
MQGVHTTIKAWVLEAPQQDGISPRAIMHLGHTGAGETGQEGLCVSASDVAHFLMETEREHCKKDEAGGSLRFQVPGLQNEGSLARGEMGFKRFAMPCAAIQALTTNELMSQAMNASCKGWESQQWKQLSGCSNGGFLPHHKAWVAQGSVRFPTTQGHAAPTTADARRAVHSPCGTVKTTDNLGGITRSTRSCLPNIYKGIRDRPFEPQRYSGVQHQVGAHPSP